MHGNIDCPKMSKYAISIDFRRILNSLLSKKTDFIYSISISIESFPFVEANSTGINHIWLLC